MTVTDHVPSGPTALGTEAKGSTDDVVCALTGVVVPPKVVVAITMIHTATAHPDGSRRRRWSGRTRANATGDGSGRGAAGGGTALLAVARETRTASRPLMFSMPARSQPIGDP